eukprot:777101-Rhodomonas_salina.1
MPDMSFPPEAGANQHPDHANSVEMRRMLRYTSLSDWFNQPRSGSNSLLAKMALSVLLPGQKFLRIRN